MAATVEIVVKIQDMRWFREFAFRTGDLIESLEDLELPPEIERKLIALRAAVVANHSDDLPSP